MKIRELSTSKYILAAVITIGIFMFGLLLGLVIEGKRIAYIESVSKYENMEYNSLQLQYAFVDQLSKEDNCDAVSKTFEDNIKNLESTRKRLEGFDKNTQLNKDEFNLLKRDYVLAQVRYWLLARRTKDICKNQIATILYFYSNDKECPNCANQAFVLDYLKKLFKDKLLIFSFDAQQEDEPMIPIFRHTYNITEYPALVIVGQKFSGLMDKNALLSNICQYYQNDTNCNGYTPVKNESNQTA
ncbi:MAG: hypothetical protein KKC75_02085 [Nanoarchaeota archaeon]|nr:hypothetical protein [Nanoarchaeota archaeon]MBU1004648.1 hypothetical protein [Nanoarchaeota archaeon]MBU1946202.1 hypothetical protein [Nanoarchaeota archaeon]